MKEHQARNLNKIEWIIGKMTCDDLHHTPSQRHDAGEPCPAMKDAVDTFAAIRSDFAELEEYKFMYEGLCE